MSKKFVGLAPLLAILAFAVVPAGAQAATQHFYVAGSPLAEGTEGKDILTWGTLTTTSTAIGALVCKNTFTGHIENPTGGGAGKATIEGFNAYHCTNAACESFGKKIEVVPGGLKTSTEYGVWKGELTELTSLGALKIEGIVFEAVCPEVFKSALGGSLTVNTKKGESFAVPSKLEFKGATSGTLVGETSTATVSGKVKVQGYEGSELVNIAP